MGRQAQAGGGAVAVTDREPAFGRERDLRLGIAADAAAGAEQPDAGDRAAAERREAAHAGGAARGGGAAAGRTRAGLPGPYARAFYAGLRREEIYRLEWEDVELDGSRLVVRKSKSAAGTNRRPPIAEPLREILRAAALRNPSDDADPVSVGSVMSGKHAQHAAIAWE